MDLALHASDILLSTTQTLPQEFDDHTPYAHHLDPAPEDAFSAPPPLMHFPHCRLDISTLCSAGFPPAAAAGAPSSRLEQVALPGPLVRTLLSRFESTIQQNPQPTSSSSSPPPSSASSSSSRRRHKAAEQRVQIQQHFDDADDWVFSRCLLGDFTGFREDEAEVLSSQGRLCCWASVVLQPQPEEEDGEGQGERGKWQLGFVVQRVGVRDPGSGWCECF
jgi:hypothetical protein